MADVKKAGARPRLQARGSEDRMGRARSWAWDWIKSIGGAFVLFILIRTFLVQTYVITSGSMENTLLVGDLLMLSRAAYGAEIPGTEIRLPGYTELQRGDIVVFRGPHEPDLDLVKRLVGLPGDTLAMREGVFYVNGEANEEPYVQAAATGPDLTHPWMVWQRSHLAPGVDPETYVPTLHNWGPIVVPADRYFMLGDNRDNSLDSRYWGFAERGKIKGEAVVIYYSYDATAMHPFPAIRDVRWGRIGDRIR